MFLLGTVLLLSAQGRAGEVRQYGDYFRDKYIVHATEEDGTVTIRMTTLDRATGGPDASKKAGGRRATSEDETIIRYYKEEYLASIRSEILLPAPPNYVKNPGRMYRITVQGLELDPYFNVAYDVNAADVLDSIEYQFKKMVSRHEGIYRDALYYGMLLGMRALNEAQRLPARLPLTVEKSKVGEVRLSGPFLEGREIPKLQRFTSVEEGASYKQFFDNPLVTRFHLPQPEPAEKPSRIDAGLKRFGDEERLAPRAYDFRSERLRGLRDPRRGKDTPGIPVAPLAERNSPLYPVGVVADYDELQTGRAAVPPLSDLTLEPRLGY
ncbi:MAG: hypothetical protein GC168_06760 [Candidatus Hydrogenedens sp.]|nr:hypothetical protein [Candidatus Hydrogenedens sp.]